MACNITILPPTGQETDDGQGITTLTISGTAECNTLRVQVQQTHPVNILTPEKSVTVTDHQWSVDLTVAAGDFQLGDFVCGVHNKYVINVQCEDDANCTEQLTGSLINCDACPDVTITATPDACVNGRRAVHFKAEVISVGDTTYTWFFGTDEDNQPGEDSQAGDGNSNFWLPAPDSNGLRTVETVHIYEPSGDQPQAITVKLVTSGGPSALCTAQQTFTLEPCKCDLTVSLRMLNSRGVPVSENECLAPGDYSVEASSPTGTSIEYFWSVNGVADNSQSSSTFSFSIGADEQKTVSVYVEQGGCNGSNAITVAGCVDCSHFDAQLRILDSSQRNVTDDDCLQPGRYTVQVTSPSGTGNTYRWSVDNVVDASVTGTAMQVNLAQNDEKTVTLEAARGNCRDTASVVLGTCPVVPITERNEELIPCMFFKILALLGLGLLILGLILLLCPTITMPLIPAQATIIIGISLSALGMLLYFLGLFLWILICRPDNCDWLAFIWQALVLLGLLLIYAGFCPTCSWMWLGIIFLALGVVLSVRWSRNCRITHCGVLAQWISLFTFVVNAVVGLEMILAVCAIVSNPVGSIVWGLLIAGIQAWLWYDFNRSRCIRD